METESQAESQANLSNLWLSIWVRPRQTIRWIVDIDPKQQVMLLAVLFGMSSVTIEYLNLVNILLGLLLAILIGMLVLFVGGALLRWIGSWFDGQATTEEVRAAIAWATVPNIWAYLFLLIPKLLLMVGELSIGLTSILTTTVGSIETIVGIWSLVLLVLCLSEVHKFSVWKAIAAVLILLAPIIGLFACLVFGFFGLFGLMP